MKTFNNYSEFCLWITENDDQVEYIVSYDDWSVVKIGIQYFFYEHEIEGDSDEFYEVEPVAQLHYDAFNDVQDEEALYTLFENDMCGEQITDNEIIYWWFKAIEE